jgi:hypothetical protein
MWQVQTGSSTYASDGETRWRVSSSRSFFGFFLIQKDLSLSVLLRSLSYKRYVPAFLERRTDGHWSTVILKRVHFHAQWSTIVTAWVYLNEHIPIFSVFTGHWTRIPSKTQDLWWESEKVRRVVDEKKNLCQRIIIHVDMAVVVGSGCSTKMQGVGRL